MFSFPLEQLFRQFNKMPCKILVLPSVFPCGDVEHLCLFVSCPFTQNLCLPLRFDMKFSCFRWPMEIEMNVEQSVQITKLNTIKWKM